jgi:molecular chaperone GrpE
MVKDALYKVLESDGLKLIEALEKPYDPNLHEAIETVEDRSKPKGINIEVVSKGYLYKEQLLRPAMVKINEWSDENGEDK